MAQHPRSRQQTPGDPHTAADSPDHLRQLARFLARLSAREVFAGSEAIEDEDAETD